MVELERYGIILASGTGTRYSNDIPKQFVKIAGKTVLEHTIEVFEKNKNIDKIILVITPEYRYTAESIIQKQNYRKIFKILNGGTTRKESSYIGISSITEQEAFVVIHDCARPFLSEEIIDNCIKALEKYDAVDVAIPSVDTIIKVKDQIIESIPERKYYMRGQTPQCFRLSVIKKAHELSGENTNFTDDCGLVVKYNLADVFVVEGELENIKITYPSDIYLADRLFQIKRLNVPKTGDFSRLKNKIIVTFGGTSGIGKAITDFAAKYGAKAYAFSRKTGCDISSYTDVAKVYKNIFEKEGKIDCVINTAGILNIGKLADRSIKDIKSEIDINYMGTINVIKNGIQYLKETKGCFLLFSSSSYTRGRAGYSTYSSAKAGIVNIVQALSEEFEQYGIRINAINPQRTATPMRKKAFGNEPKDSLLDVNTVAESTLDTFLSDVTGEIIDIRKEPILLK